MSPAKPKSRLERHLLEAPGLYKVALGEGKPSSIRDQIRKAVTLIRDACHKGQLQSGGNLIILGAGAAGVAAAWTAVERGVNIVLYDLRSGPFSVQSRCHTRWLHPNEYQWPGEDCRFDHYPLLEEAATIPPILRWTAGKPSGIAKEWRGRFRTWTRQHARVTLVRRSALLKGSVRWEPMALREFKTPQTLRAHVRAALNAGACDMALLCVGAKERCKLKGSQHRSYRYWENDLYEAPHYGSPTLPEQGLRTLVSGDGDGALQDFLRVGCRKDGITQPVHVLGILLKLLPELSQCAGYQPMMDRIISVGQRNKNRPSPKWLWEVHGEFIDSLGIDPRAAAVAAKLDRLIDPEILKKRKVLHLNLTKGYFGACFTLNAFLVRLFDWHIKEITGEGVFQPGAMTKAVQSRDAAHRCRQIPGLKGCLLKPHLVVFKRSKREVAGLEAVYHVIIIRHGVVSLARS